MREREDGARDDAQVESTVAVISFVAHCAPHELAGRLHVDSGDYLFGALRCPLCAARAGGAHSVCHVA